MPKRSNYDLHWMVKYLAKESDNAFECLGKKNTEKSIKYDLKFVISRRFMAIIFQFLLIIFINLKIICFNILLFEL